MTTALVIDDHPIVLQGCERVLKESDVDHVVLSSSFAEGFRLYRKHSPDVILLDLAVGSDAIGGLTFLRRLRMHDSRTPVLIFSMYDDAMLVTRAIKLGATGYLLKITWQDEFREAFEQVKAGKKYISHELASEIAFLNQQKNENPLHALSLRELSVLNLIVEGKSYGEIAKRLNVSYKTIANTASHIKSKLDAHSLIELVQIAARHLPDIGRAPKGLADSAVNPDEL